MKSTITRPRSKGRTASVVAGYAVVLLAVVAVALTADFGMKTSVARDAVAVAVAPEAVIPIAQAAIGAAGSGKLTGVILFDGTPEDYPPVVKKGDMTTKDAAICAAHDVPYEELVVNKDNKGIANVFVYMAKAPKKWKPGAEPIVFDQKGCQFLPHCLIAPAGSHVLVKNDDALLHNTHTNPLRNSGFNQSIAANDRTGVALKYEKPERLPVKVVCDVHPWMKAWHLVVDHPYTAVTDGDGKFEIADLPAGKHEFIIWQEKAGYLNRKYEAEIKSGESKEIKLSFGPAKFAGAGDPRTKTIAVNVAQ